MTSPGVTALRARAGASTGGTAALSPLAAAVLGAGQRLPPTAEAMQAVTAVSPGQGGSTVPARARLHTEPRRCSTAGKCRLLPGCTSSTAPSDTCAGRGGTASSGLRPSPGRDNCPCHSLPSWMEREKQEPPSLRESPPAHTPVSAGQGQRCLPLPLSSLRIFLSSCSLKEIPVPCPWQQEKVRSILHPNTPLPSGAPSQHIQGEG